MRIAWPFSSGNWLTSAMIDPPLLRIGPISIGFAESNTSHTVAARRNKAADVAAAKENVRLRPSLLRLASTVPSPAPVAGGGDLVSAAGSDAAGVIFGGISTAGAGVSFDGGADIGVGVSGAGGIFRAAAGLISIFACCAKVSGVGGAISPDCRDTGGASAGFSGAAGAVAAGAADTGAAETAACGTSAAGDGTADGFSG